MEWLEQHKLPLGKTVKKGVDALSEEFVWFFDSVAAVLEGGINAILWLLETPPVWVVVLAITLLSWLARRSWGFSLFTLCGLLLIVNQGYWGETMETLALVMASGILCMGFGVPIGIAAARRRWLYRALEPVLDLMQTIPTFVYLIPALILFGLGMVPGLIATVIFAIPAPIRLTYLGVSSTPAPLLEAGRAFGAGSWQMLWKIELPHALPQIMAGLTQTIMLSLSMVVIAALVGADGLGVPTLRALNTANIAKGFEVGIPIVLVAIIFDRMLRRPGGRR